MEKFEVVITSNFLKDSNYPEEKHAGQMEDRDNKKARVLKAAFGCRTELLAYARSLLGNFAAAEDAVQETMVVVMNKYDQF